jgi:hypothetical protein
MVKIGKQSPKKSNKIAQALLLFIGGLFFLLAQSAFWINNTVFDQKTFVGITNSVITSQSSRDAIASSIVDRAFADRPLAGRLLSDRATVFISSLLGTDLSLQAINGVNEKTYQYATSPNRRDIAIELNGIKQPMVGLVTVLEQQGKTVEFNPDNIPDRITLLRKDSFPDFSGYIQKMLILAPILWLVTIVCFGLYLYFGRSNINKSVYTLGFTIIGFAILGLLSGPFVPPMIAAQMQEINLRIIASDLIKAFIDPFTRQMWVSILLSAALMFVYSQRNYIVFLANKITGYLPTTKTKNASK